MNCCGHCHLISLPHFETLVAENRVPHSDVLAARALLSNSHEWEPYSSLLVILRDEVPVGFFLCTPSSNPLFKFFPDFLNIKGIIQSEICSELEVTGVL